MPSGTYLRQIAENIIVGVRFRFVKKQTDFGKLCLLNLSVFYVIVG